MTKLYKCFILTNTISINCIFNLKISSLNKKNLNTFLFDNKSNRKLKNTQFSNQLIIRPKIRGPIGANHEKSKSSVRPDSSRSPNSYLFFLKFV
ncbi:hypothetical protein BpHYR1_029866 [Brachionus plicatilis]|uniref:Uncharacterized protein n=1 Tax=Brachionus plicatilis TaxID=10195 RepID=A0A3M7S9A1_BRAPC|nr:hypothetical protein BpHYR1_029866 [Brachionus plicatilis]